MLSEVGTMLVGKERALTGSEEVFDIECFPCNSGGKHMEAEGYCIDCGEHLCGQCLKYHRTLSATKQHKLIDKENKSAALEKNLEFKKFKQYLDQLIRKSEMIFTSAEQNSKTADGFVLRVQQDICTFRNELNAALDKLEMEMKEKLDQVYTEIKDRQEAVSTEASKTNEALQIIAANFQELISTKQNLQVFKQMENTENDLVKLQDAVEKIEDTYRHLQVGRFIPNAKLMQMMKREEILGELVMRNASELCVVPVTDIDVWTDGDACNISGVSVLCRGKLVIIDQHNKLVKLIDLVDNKITSTLPLPGVPWSVTAISETKVAVTLPKTERIIFISCDNELHIERKVSVDGQCYGIAYFQGKLVVTFVDPGKVEILDMAGDVLQCFKKDEQGHQLFINARYVSVYMNNTAMFVSDWDTDSLTMLSMDGKVLAVYKDPDLLSPGQCAIDRFGLVYLCGTSSHNIHMLTTECTRIKTVLTRTNGLQYPSSISFCETTERLYLGMRNSDLVKVLSVK